MTCRDVTNLLPLFFDGELDSRQMRALALHSSRCTSCEGELSQMEGLQELLRTTINKRVDEVDLSHLWSSIEVKLPARRISATQRLLRWWEESAPRWNLGVPAFAAAAMLAALAFFFLTQTQQPGATPAAPQIVIAESNEASIDSLETEADSVALMSDPETSTTLLWVSDDSIVEDAAQ